ncbi:Heme exporter protein B [Saezia sanguinis]|jgi:heme exporter protein B|uniref:Heme exporter protein B n=1 Tax=Saezia sanguinis TaxID=1965230 RepID=A0A433SAQ0_9BURK|nr:heme exporter protein CcmB [Saezia sanguinis]RUS65818.1 Heme exporter protein B [Saezia sanguinis]
MTGMLLALLKKELCCAFRKRIEIANTLLFFVIIVTLFPISIDHDVALLRKIAPGIICVAALLSTLLSLERLFTDDLHDGTLEQLVLLPVPFSLVVLTKVFCHWLTTGLPLILISPVIALLLSLDVQTWLTVVLVLLLSTPALSFIGAVGAALTVSLRKGSILLSLLTLPLYIPTLIFSTLAINASMLSQPITGYLALLAAISVGSITLMPLFIAAALKINLQ